MNRNRLCDALQAQEKVNTGAMRRDKESLGWTSNVESSSNSPTVIIGVQVTGKNTKFF